MEQSRRRLRAEWVVVPGVAALLGVLTAYAPVLAVALCGAVILSVLTLYRPAWAALTLAAWLPLEGFVLKQIPGSTPAIVVSEFVTMNILIWTLAQSLKPKTDSGRVNLWLLWPAGLLALGAAVSWVLNVTPVIDALYWVRVHLRFVPLALACAIPVYSSQIRARIVHLAAFTAITQGAIGLMELIGGASVARFFWPGQFSLGGVASQGDTLLSVGGRYVAGTVSHYNQYGLLMVTCLGVLLASWLSDISRGERTVGPIRSVAMIMSAMMVVMSQSRQAIAIGLLMVPLILTTEYVSHGSLGRRIAALVGVVGAAVIGAATVASDLTGRIAWVLSGDYLQYEAAANRGYVATVVTNAVARVNPLFGMGPGSFGTGYGSDAGPVGVGALGLDVVSSRFVGDVGWVSVFAQTGLVGLLGALGIVFVSLRIFFDRIRAIQDRSMGWAIACVIGVGMVASTPLIYKSVSAMLWLMFGLIALAGEEAVVDEQA